jgi:hypothetical protein
MPMITRLPLSCRSAGGLRSWHADPGTDQPAGVRVGHERVGEDVEHLVQ